MKVGDLVVVISHTPHGGQQFDKDEVVEIIRIGTGGNIKCSNGNESWWLVPSEFRLLIRDRNELCGRLIFDAPELAVTSPRSIISRLVNAFSFDKSNEGEDLAEQNSALNEARAFLDKNPGKI